MGKKREGGDQEGKETGDDSSSSLTTIIRVSEIFFMYFILL